MQRRAIPILFLLMIVLSALPSFVAGDVPSAPEGFTAQRDGSRIFISWRPPAEGDVLSYNVYRGTSPDDLVLYDSVDANFTAGYDTEVLRGTTYYYAISANGTAGEGALSPVVKVPPPSDDYPALVMTLILAAIVVTLLFAYRKGRSRE